MTSGCAWKSNLSRKIPRKQTNPVRRNDPIPEMARTPTLGAYSAWTVKTPRKTPIHRPIRRVWSPTRLVHHTPVKGEAAEAGEAVAEAGIAAGAEDNMRKESGIAFSIRKTMTIV
jgi:hypothetical protein